MTFFKRKDENLRNPGTESYRQGRRKFIKITLDPTLAPGVSAVKGDRAWSLVTEKWYQKQDNGLSTNWIELPLVSGSGSLLEREFFNLNTGNISDEYVELSTIAIHDSVIVNLDSAGILTLNTQYNLVDIGGVTRVSWAGGPLSGIIDNTDNLEIQYQI